MCRLWARSMLAIVITFSLKSHVARHTGGGRLPTEGVVKGHVGQSSSPNRSVHVRASNSHRGGVRFIDLNTVHVYRQIILKTILLIKLANICATPNAINTEDHF